MIQTGTVTVPSRVREKAMPAASGTGMVRLRFMGPLSLRLRDPANNEKTPASGSPGHGHERFKVSRSQPHSPRGAASPVAVAHSVPAESCSPEAPGAAHRTPLPRRETVKSPRPEGPDGVFTYD